MKIAINTDNNDLYNAFYKVDNQILNVKIESTLFDVIEKNIAEAYVLSVDKPYFKKAVEFIKKSNPYVPIIGILPEPQNTGISINAPADIFLSNFIPESMFVTTVLHNINSYVKTFATLQKLTAKMHDKIEFANCTYDPTRRVLYYKGKEIKKLSTKEGGILEILAINYGTVVKKEVILEKVWRKTDYFAGRSMDVYITYLRNTLKDNKIKLSIKNISGIGLILE